MRIIPPTMQALLDTDDIAALSTFWLITRRDGVQLGFTDWTADVRAGGVTYEAGTGVSKSALQHRVDLAVPNQEISGILTSDAIKAGDIRAGRYNGAKFMTFMAVPTDTDFGTYGRIILPGAFLGEVTINDGVFLFEVRGLSYALTQNFIEVIAPVCKTEFCDSFCKLNEADFTVTGTVTSIAGQYRSIISSDIVGPGLSSPVPPSNQQFAFGRLDWLTGDNAATSVEIESQNGDGPSWQVTFSLPTFYPIQVGDTFNAVVGCDKTITRCVALANAKNFRGEPYVPGYNLLLDVGIAVP